MIRSTCPLPGGQDRSSSTHWLRCIWKFYIRDPSEIFCSVKLTTCEVWDLRWQNKFWNSIANIHFYLLVDCDELFSSSGRVDVLLFTITTTLLYKQHWGYFVFCMLSMLCARGFPACVIRLFLLFFLFTEMTGVCYLGKKSFLDWAFPQHEWKIEFSCLHTSNFWLFFLFLCCFIFIFSDLRHDFFSSLFCFISPSLISSLLQFTYFTIHFWRSRQLEGNETFPLRKSWTQIWIEFWYFWRISHHRAAVYNKSITTWVSVKSIH